MDRTVHTQHAQIVQQLGGETAVLRAGFDEDVALELLVDRLDGGDQRGGGGRQESVAKNGAQKEKKAKLLFVLMVRWKSGRCTERARLNLEQ